MTFNDLPSGVYNSQVIDVIKYLNSLRIEKVKLISVIPIRGYWKNRAIIKSYNVDSIVLPIPIKLKYWKWCRIYLSLIPKIRKSYIIARGPMACSLVLKFSNNVVYDGRAAVSAELDEFPAMVVNKKLVDEIKIAERESVLNSKWQLAVSNKLIDYWIQQFNYSYNTYNVIPCLISTNELISSTEITREKLGIIDDEIVVAFSGGIGGWQSSSLLFELLDNLLSKDRLKLILLANLNDNFKELMIKYPGKIIQEWVKPNQVNNYLKCADYGVLLRDDLVTNRVASPVKFAEYLAAGLKVLISPNIGDFSELVVQNDLGLIVNQPNLDLIEISNSEKIRIQKFAQTHFTKHVYKIQYENLFNIKIVKK